MKKKKNRETVGKSRLRVREEVHGAGRWGGANVYALLDIHERE